MLVLLDRADADLTECRRTRRTSCLHCTPAVNLFPKRADRIHLIGHGVRSITSSSGPHAADGLRGLLDRGVSSATEPAPTPNSRSALLRHDRPTAARPPGLLHAAPRAAPALLQAAVVRPTVELRGKRGLPLAGRCETRRRTARTSATRGPDPLHEPRPAAAHAGRPGPDRLHAGDRGPGAGDPLRRRSDPAAAARSAEGEVAWRLISHLSLNYLSLLETTSENGGAALCGEMLTLYADATNRRRKQIEGVRLGRPPRPVTRRIPGPGRWPSGAAWRSR